MDASDPQLTLTLWHYVAAITAGMAAGGINILAGNGSAITLPILIFLGLDANIANGTNRVGVLLSTLVGARTFAKHGLIDWKGITWLMGPTVVGAIVGTTIAVMTGPMQMKVVIGVVMVFMLAMVLIKPNRWIKEEGQAQRNHRKLSTAILFFAIGAYGGFIQAGVGLLLLSALVLRAGYTLVRANGIKLVVVLAVTAPALAIFVYKDQVNWKLGLLMATGQIIGAYLAAKFAANHPQANIWLRRLLVVMILAALVKLFGVMDYL